MSARLLVYGGNAHEIRCQLGRWAAFSAGALREKDGISLSGPFACGFGATAAQGRFFLYREMQSFGGREYPFTVLLDPGDEVLIRFEGNGALLMSELSKTATWKAVRDNPISVTFDQLTATLEALSVPIIDPAPVEHFREALPLFLVPDRIDATSPICLSLDDLKVEQRPNWGGMAELISYLPVAFRGVSWVAGCPKASARIFGCRIVFDDPATKPTETRARLDSLRTEGNRRLDLVERAKSTEATAGICNSRLSQGYDKWDTLPGDFYLGLETVLNLIDAVELTPSLIDAADQASQRVPEFAPMIQGLTEKLDDSSDAGYSRERTVNVLDKAFTSKKHVPATAVNKLHRESVSDWLRKKQIPPQRLPGQVRLPKDVLRNECGKYLAQSAADFNTRYTTICNAFGDQLTGDDLTQPVENAFRRFILPPVPWLDLINVDSRNDSILKPLLITAANVALEDLTPQWFIGYLSVIDDPGAKILSHLENRRAQRIGEAADGILGIARGSVGGKAAERLQDPAGRWLLALASSGAREFLNANLKIRIAQQIGGDWTSLSTLNNIFRWPEVSAVSPAPQQFVQYLDEEAVALWSQEPSRISNKRLLRDSLTRFLGRLPQKLVAEFQDHGDVPSASRGVSGSYEQESFGRNDTMHDQKSSWFVSKMPSSLRKLVEPKEPAWWEIARHDGGLIYADFVNWYRRLNPDKVAEFEKELLIKEKENDKMLSAVLEDPRVLHFLCAVTASVAHKSRIIQIYSMQCPKEYQKLTVEVISSGLNGPFNRHALFEALAKFVTSTTVPDELKSLLTKATHLPFEELIRRLKNLPSQ